MKILWLASWYPSRIAPFNGDFVQRHAEAVSLYQDVCVIHVVKDSKGSAGGKNCVDVVKKGRLEERTVYYHNPLDNVPVLRRIFSHLRYVKLYKRQIESYLKEAGKPDVVHVHVCLKAGLLALWAKRKHGLPYVVTEHSTFFLPEASENILNAPFYLQKLCRRVLKEASAVSVVSANLGNAVKKFAKAKRLTYTVIPNVVNTAIFRPIIRNDNASLELIHVSGLGHQKNFDAIIEALCVLKKSNPNFVLRVFGSNGKPWLHKIVNAGLTGRVLFYGEVPQPQLASHLQKADALILFSRYETFGCVLIEAAACGVPVVVNDIPPMEEIVAEGFTGLVVENNSAALAEGLRQLLEKRLSFNKWAMADQAEKAYGYKNIGQAFSFFYQTALESAHAQGLSKRSNL